MQCSLVHATSKVGAFLLTNFVGIWASLQTFNCKCFRKNETIKEVHSPAFGDRGIFLKFRNGKGNSLQSSAAPRPYRSLMISNDMINIIDHCILILVIGMFVSGTKMGIFDLTCGYPGEGPSNQTRSRKKRSKQWSNENPNLSMATWNTRSLTRERFQYCSNLGYDVLALTELWRSAPRYADGTVRWTYGEARINKETG